MVNEIHDVAGQHEQIAENLATHIAKELQTLVHELKKERKEVTGPVLRVTVLSSAGRSALFYLSMFESE